MAHMARGVLMTGSPNVVSEADRLSRFGDKLLVFPSDGDWAFWAVRGQVTGCRMMSKVPTADT